MIETFEDNHNIKGAAGHKITHEIKYVTTVEVPKPMSPGIMKLWLSVMMPMFSTTGQHDPFINT